MESNTTLPSELEIERLLLEDHAIPQAWKQHPDIAATIERLTQDQVNFLKKHPFANHWPHIETKLEKTKSENIIPLHNPKKSWTKIISISFAIAATLMLAVNFKQHFMDTNYVAIKGTNDFGFYFYSSSSNQAQVGSTGTQLKKGDKIRFYYSSSEPIHLMVIGIEEHGNINLYFPDHDSTQSVSLTTSNQQILAPTYELDRFQGKEHYVAIFSKTALDYTTIKQYFSNTPESLAKIEQNPKLKAFGFIKSFWIEKTP